MISYDKNLNPPGINHLCAGSSVFGRSGRSDAIEDRVRVRAFMLIGFIYAPGSAVQQRSSFTNDQYFFLFAV